MRLFVGCFQLFKWECIEVWYNAEKIYGHPKADPEQKHRVPPLNLLFLFLSILTFSLFVVKMQCLQIGHLRGSTHDSHTYYRAFSSGSD